STCRTKAFLRVREIAPDGLDQPLHVLDTAEQLHVTTRLCDVFEMAQLCQGRLLLGGIETGDHDLEPSPGRVGTATRLQVADSRPERRAGMTLEIVEALGFSKRFVAAGLRAKWIARISG